MVAVVELVIPERASGVKGLLANFWMHVLRLSRLWLFVGFVDGFVDGFDWFKEPFVACGCRGHVLRGCCAVLFVYVRQHPNSFLRESACLPAVVQAR
jgi:hypothetical protein